MGNSNKYVQGWLERRAQAEKPTAQKPEVPESKVEVPRATPKQTLPGTMVEPTVAPAAPAVRAGYRSEPDNVWHPAPGAKAYLTHIEKCSTCKAEADKLGIKAE